MHKLRDSYDLSKKLHSKDNLTLVKFEKKRIINISDLD